MSRKKGQRKRRKWSTVVGEHVPQPTLGDPVAQTGIIFEAVANDSDAGPVASDEQRERLLYERGVGPMRPDEKPEPSGGPRDRRGFRPSPRAPRILDGRGED